MERVRRGVRSDVVTEREAELMERVEESGEGGQGGRGLPKPEEE